MKRRIPRAERMTTTPIENIIQHAPDQGVTLHRHYRQYAAMCVKLAQARALVGLALESYVASRLGAWDYTFTGEFRHRVWETPKWRVFVSGKKGVCFEVLPDLTIEEALAAWEEFVRRMGLPECLDAADGPALTPAKPKE